MGTGKIRPQLPALLQPRKKTQSSFVKMWKVDSHRCSINPNLQNDKFAPHGESLTSKIQSFHTSIGSKKSLTASLTCNPDNAQGVSYHSKKKPRQKDGRKNFKSEIQKCHSLQSEHCNTTKPNRPVRLILLDF